MSEEKVLYVNDVSFYQLNLLINNYNIVLKKKKKIKRKMIKKERKIEGRKMLEFRKWREINRLLKNNRNVIALDNLMREYMLSAAHIIELYMKKVEKIDNNKHLYQLFIDDNRIFIKLIIYRKKKWEIILYRVKSV